MRVLYVFMELPVGGAEQILLTVMRHLAGQPIQPLVCCIRSKGPIGMEIEKLGVEVISLNHHTKSFDWVACRELARLIKERNIDLVHTQLYHPNLYGRIAAIMAGVPAIATEQNVYPHVKLKRRIANWLLAKKTAKIIAVSKAVHDYILKRDWLSPEKVVTVCNSVDLAAISPDLSRTEARRQLGLPPDAFIIGNVGRLETQKGQCLLLEAAKQLRIKIPGFMVLIVGKGQLHDELARQIQKENLGDCVQLLGSRRDISLILRALDAFALPSHWEGLPVALLEAMAARLPVIATPVGGIPEFLEHGVNGLVIPVANVSKLVEAVSKVFEDRAFSESIALRAMETVRLRFGADAMVSQLKALYSEAMVSPSPK